MSVDSLGVLKDQDENIRDLELLANTVEVDSADESHSIG